MIYDIIYMTRYVTIRYDIGYDIYDMIYLLTHCGRVTKICVFDTVKLGTSASSP